MAGNGKHYSAKIINTSALLFHSAFDTTALFDEATQQKGVVITGGSGGMAAPWQSVSC
jgi:hypothetical protein